MREETRVISGERQSGVVSPAASASSATSCLPARGAAVTAGPPLPSPAAVATPPVGPPSKDGLHVVLVERPPRTMDVAPTRGRGTGGREKPNTGSSLDEAALFQSRAQATTAVVASLGSHGQAVRGGGAVQAAPWPPDATREAWRSTHVYTAGGPAAACALLLSSPLLSSPASTLRVCPSGGVCTSRPSHEAVAARGPRSGAARRPRLAPVSRLGQQARAEGVRPPEGNLRTAGGCLGRVEEGDASRGVRRVREGCERGARLGCERGARRVREGCVSLVSRWLQWPVMAAPRPSLGRVFSATSWLHLGDISATVRPHFGYISATWTARSALCTGSVHVLADDTTPMHYPDPTLEYKNCGGPYSRLRQPSERGRLARRSLP